MNSEMVEAIASMSPEEKEKLRHKLTSDEAESYNGPKFTIAFPEEEQLECIDFYSPVPRVGDIISLRSMTFQSDKGYDYNLRMRNRWKVTEVIHVALVNTRLKDRLIYQNHMRIEVYVELIK